jgi:pimeloyl-ACP methyl ester carboxylesterase
MLATAKSVEKKVTSALRGEREGVPRFAYWNQPLSAEKYEAYADADGWRTDLLASGGATLRGLVRPPSRRDAPWLLFYSGNSDTYFAESRRLLEAIARDKEYGVVTWAYRGYDGSTGEPAIEPLVEDAHRIYEHALGVTGAAPAKLHVAGFSLGTYLATAMAARLGANARRPASLMLLSPCTVMDIARPARIKRLERFRAADRYDLMQFLPSLPGPVLVAHGDRDAALPVQMGRDVAAGLARLGDHVRYVEVAGAGHADLLNHAETHAAVRAMLDAPTRPA